MLRAVTTCRTVKELNQARRDLFRQVFKRGITPEELDVAYESLVQHSAMIGLKYHLGYYSYGPTNIEPIRTVLEALKQSRFIKQFQSAADQILREYEARRMSYEQYEMLWTVMMDQAAFQGYEWNIYQAKFYEL